jgi:hypothetical protein
VDFERAQRDYAEYRSAIVAERNKLTEKVRLLRLAGALLERVSFAWLTKNEQGATDDIDRQHQEMALVGGNYCVEPSEYSRAWETTGRVLARLKETVEARGSKLVVFTVPALEVVSGDYRDDVIQSVAHPEFLCLEQAPGHTRLSQMLTERSIEQIELMPYFRSAMSDEHVQLYYLSEGMHWNEAGHKLAAEQVVSELMSRQLLPMADAPRSVLP